MVLPTMSNYQRIGGGGAGNSTSGADPRRPTKTLRICGSVILAFCLLSILENILSTSGSGRRSLLSELYLGVTHSTLMPWAYHHLVDVKDKPNPDAETALFWHIPKSGGTTAKRLYQCMGQTLAHRVGADPKFGHDQTDEVVVFEPHQGKDWKVVNVDTTIKPGILRAKKMGLVQSHKTDMIFTMEPQFAGEHLYDEENKARFVSLFRHPVGRAVSMFYYLQTATWEKTYRPEWKDMSIIEWANLPNAEEDYMVHKLVGKSFGEKVDETDLIVAKELVRQRFIVGLMDEMEESVRRFNIVLGVDESKERSQQCMKEFGFGPKEENNISAVESDGGEKSNATDKKNSNKHPKVEEFSPEFEAIASRNPMDMLLYQYILRLFDEQKEIVDSYFSEEEAEHLLPAGDIHEFFEDPREEAVAKKKAVSLLPKEIDANLMDVTNPFSDGSSTAFFWHVPKCGGTTLQRLYWCMGFTLANEVGANPKFGYNERDDLIAFRPWDNNPGQVVNVDVSSHEGIMNAKKKGFLVNSLDPSHPHVDLISTTEFQFASMMLYTPEHQGRMFALFRHPVDRAVSKFFYLRKAKWEPTYNERWAGMSLDEWASRERGENNWMVRQLISKSNQEPLTSKDLELAKEIIRTKFVVGLMDQFEESVHRFNFLLGVDESDAQNNQCINEYTANEKSKSISTTDKNTWNSYSHPEVTQGSAAWRSLHAINYYDVLLYRYIREQFWEQEALFRGVSS